MTKGSIFWKAYWIERLAAVESEASGSSEILRNLPGASSQTREKLKNEGLAHRSTSKAIVSDTGGSLLQFKDCRQECYMKKKAYRRGTVQVGQIDGKRSNEHTRPRSEWR